MQLWWEAGRNTGLEQRRQLMPRDQVFLDEAQSLCRNGYIYSVPKGLYRQEQIAWLKAIIRFQFGDSIGGYPVSFQLHVSEPVTWDDMQTRLKDRRFSDWAGTAVIDAIRELGEARSDLKADAKNLPHCRSDGCQEFFGYPTVRQYNDAETKLGEVLRNEFRVLETDNEVDCD